MRRSCSGAVGPLFWTLIECGGLGVGWLSHVSPVTDQPLQVIYGADHNATGDVFGVWCLMLLMGCVLVATLYSTYRWYHQRHVIAPDLISR
ncbi:MAG: hypothetical protein H8K05_09775 [Nitrospira sp.]|nr:hypothetical protein [Nitrospira sp.]